MCQQKQIKIVKQMSWEWIPDGGGVIGTESIRYEGREADILSIRFSSLSYLHTHKKKKNNKIK